MLPFSYFPRAPSLVSPSDVGAFFPIVPVKSVLININLDQVSNQKYPRFSAF